MSRSAASGADRFATQLDAVRRAAEPYGVCISVEPPTAGEGGGVVADYLYEERVLLAKPSHDDLSGVGLREKINSEARHAVRDAEGDAARQPAVVVTDNIERLAGGRLLRLPLADLGGDEARRALDWLASAPADAAVRSRGVDPRLITHNHLVSICHTSLCPADEPYPVIGRPDRTPPAGRHDDGSGVHIEVIDTGLIEDWETSGLLIPGAVQPRPSSSRRVCGSRTDGMRSVHTVELDECTGEEVQLIREYAGHGTFIAGIIQQVAPAATVRVSNDLQWAGAITEACLGEALVDALCPNEGPVPDIISLSAGGRTRGGARHLGLDPFYEMLTASDSTLLVAAAGNDGDTEPFWPAAYAGRPFTTDPPAVIAVGALREDGRGRACFSNFGEWVSVYEAGERYVNAFPRGSYRYVDPPTRRCWYHRPALYSPCTCVTAPPQHARVCFDGLASWSGTSFATPHVAARIATYMSRTGKSNARLAAAELFAEQCERISDAADHLRLTVFRD